ncbi:YwdI family protein [Microbacterium sp. APC 3898]|uniref:YwdI family protein n=2 Tax=Planococcus TaxID=1372 RepID=A0ABT7ZKZ4_9BACL|nr:MULTISPECIES: YwdI family protein [Terrabacteria group]MBD8013245.1 YwdI family protein [Planococcus wigleyi]MDN3427821.1 YwdI family protein [Planococcus sp. APC 4016]MDN3437175.1 YwdI family protein [Planococcus sp. APC 3900]MDN3499373.1 YwdI family protein [Microbacterium sp. APC 3898]
MAIDNMRILNEIDRHTTRARNGDPAKVRDSVAAIRALCDLLLEDDQPMINHQTPRAVPLDSPQPQTVSAVNKLKEEDANGDSLFEF